jgi:hypothetical protein
MAKAKNPRYCMVGLLSCRSRVARSDTVPALGPAILGQKPVRSGHRRSIAGFRFRLAVALHVVLSRGRAAGFKRCAALCGGDVDALPRNPYPVRAISCLQSSQRGGNIVSARMGRRTDKTQTYAAEASARPTGVRGRATWLTIQKRLSAID